MKADDNAQWREYIVARMDRMRHFAYLTCGDWHRAEDAVQTAFTRLYTAWPRARKRSLDAYTRRIIVNVLIDESRLKRFLREKISDTLPETPEAAVDSTSRLVVLDALAKLPPRQRAILVLRFWEDQSVEQTATIVRCSASTVKKQTARGLDTLRGLLKEIHFDYAEGAHV